MSNIEIENYEKYIKIFKALGNANRFEVFLLTLSLCPPGCVCKDEEIDICVGEIGEHLNLAPSTISHHLKELREAGIIKMKRKGQKIECCVNLEELKEMAQLFLEFSKKNVSQKK